MTSAERKRDIKERKAELEAVALQSILSGTIWYDVEDASACPERCGTFNWPQLLELLNGPQLFSIKVNGRELIPDYAFDSEGRVMPVIGELLRLFPESSTLRLAAWLESTNSNLDGLRPRELLPVQPDLVTSAARAHLIGPLHG